MNKNKNIDDFFNERFKNFEPTPSPKVWSNIQAVLEEKKNRKVIPLWFKLAGAAALLALLFTVGMTYFNEPINKQENPFVTENPKYKNDTNEKNSEELLTNKREEVVFQKSDNEELEKTNSLQEKKAIYSSNNNNSKVASQESNKPKESRIENRKGHTIVPPKDGPISNTIAYTKNAKSSPNTKDSESNIQTDKDIPTTTTQTVAEEINQNETVENTALENKNTRSIFDAIDDTDGKEAVANVPRPDNRWEVTPNVGPVYYNTIGEGSSIDPSFTDNPKSSDINIAYGVQVSYYLNNRLSVRSGLSNVNLSYATTGIELGNGPVAFALKSVNYTKSDNVLITTDRGYIASQNINGEFGNITPKSTSGEPSLNQELSYYEVPLELKYAVINNKFGINLIGGFSTLFLGDNEIIVEAGDFNETLGEANNLSTVSFTTNIGLGLNYSFSKKLMFNIEPMFKYQLNPYSDTSVDFNPYYVGIYSGLSFKF
jgi:uncharacterized protein YxeA